MWFGLTVIFCTVISDSKKKNVKSAWKVSWTICWFHSHGFWLPLLEMFIGLQKQIYLQAWKRKLIWSIKYQLIQDERMVACVSSANYEQVLILSEIYLIIFWRGLHPRLSSCFFHHRLILESVLQEKKVRQNGSIKITAMRPEQKLRKQENKQLSLGSKKEEVFLARLE